MYQIKEFENIIGYEFKNKNYIKTALTHSSYANEKGMSKNEYNERIEFLGDAVLEFVSSSFIYVEHPELNEGEMTVFRAKLVCEDALAITAKSINLGDFILLGVGEEKTGGRNKNSLLSDAVEAVIGAIYLDGGIEPAKEFIYKFVLNDIGDKLLIVDSKTTLQEMVQKEYGITVSYVMVNEEGPQHNKTFTMIAKLGDTVIGKGCGHSKKDAAKNAAYDAIMRMKD